MKLIEILDWIGRHGAESFWIGVFMVAALTVVVQGIVEIIKAIK